MLSGTIHPDYADVASSLIRQIPKDRRGGAAVCVYHRGREVVDIWGGSRDAQGAPWERDTTAPSFSTTKGVLSTLLHILIDRGLADYDDPVAKHWSEFGRHGKEHITIRQALSHEAGLYRIRDMIDSPSEMLDWEHMKHVVCEARPAHAAGAHHGYHALTFGWLIGGLIEAISGRTLARVLEEELVDPLGLDGMYIGMPHNQLYRRATLVHGARTAPAAPRSEGIGADMSRWFELGLGRIGIELDELRAAMGSFDEPFDWNDEAAVQAPIPGANGQFTARSLARMYAMIAGGGALDGVRVLSEAAVRAMTEVQNRGRDKALFMPMHWRMGYHRGFAMGASAPRAFGHYGYGGSGGFCDPDRRLALAMTCNSGAGTPAGETRMPRLARTAIRAVERLREAD